MVSLALAPLADAAAGHGLPAWVTSGLAVAVILGAFGAAVGMLFRGGFGGRERFRLTLALLCFALSSLSGLLFANQSATSLVGQWGAVTLSLVGPAALWLIALIVVTRLWKDAGAPPVPAPAGPVERGLVGYREWKFKHAGLNYLFTSFTNEEYRVREILTFAYFRATDKRKPIDVMVSTLFFYYSLPEAPTQIRFLKLQRVVGRAKAPPTDVYHIFTPTLPGGSASSYAFIRVGDKIVGGSRGGPGARRWIRVESSQIDCLIVSSYPDSNPPEGDYVWIDVPKFSDTQVDVRLAFLARAAIADEGDRASKMWEVHPAWSSALASEIEVPVMFRAHGKGHVSSTGSASALRPFADWLPALDVLLAGGAAPHDLTEGEADRDPAGSLVFLAGLRDELRRAVGRPSAELVELLGPEVFPHVCEFDETSADKPLIATFQFE